MSVRPTLLSDIRRTAIVQHQLRTGNGSYNRWSPLVPRERVPSVGKRRLSDDNQGDGISASQTTKAPRFDPSLIFGQLKTQETVLAEVKGKLKGLDDLETILGDLLPPQVKTVLVSMGSALDLLLKSQDNLSSVLVDAFKVGNPIKAGSSDTLGKVEVTVKERVKNAIREAEKKSLLFNLDLGNVPTMNKETLSRKVTMALSSKVSAGDHDYDIKDAEEALDDILSCTKLEFLGSTSRKYFNKKNPKDERNDTFCTMPVRLEFKDRDTRIEAEKTLRKICSVSCAVPYPKKLRSIMDRLITEGKQRCPNSFIRTKVNVDTLTIEAHAKTTNGWLDLGLLTKIPLDICDTVTTGEPNTASQPAITVDEVMCVS
jgi:hypothetical protein